MSAIIKEIDLENQAIREKEPLTVERIRAKNITVGVVGLGYVGFPLSLVFAEAGVKVIGFDVDKSKVDSIKAGRSYIKHIDHGRLKKAEITQKLTTTIDFKSISSCDAVIICVPTPLDHHLEPDLRFVVDTCQTIAPHLKPHTLVSLESTTWPGTTDEIVGPL